MLRLQSRARRRERSSARTTMRRRKRSTSCATSRPAKSPRPKRRRGLPDERDPGRRTARGVPGAPRRDQARDPGGGPEAGPALLAARVRRAADRPDEPLQPVRLPRPVLHRGQGRPRLEGAPGTPFAHAGLLPRETAHLPDHPRDRLPGAREGADPARRLRGRGGSRHERQRPLPLLREQLDLPVARPRAAVARSVGAQPHDPPRRASLEGGRREDRRGHRPDRGADAAGSAHRRAHEPSKGSCSSPRRPRIGEAEARRGARNSASLTA